MDLYKILQVSKTADDETIRKNYKKLATKYHPDKNKEDNAEEKFKELQTAYNILKDPNKRKQYDLFGTIDQQENPSFNFNNIFNNFFNFNKYNSQNNISKIDIEIVLKLTLEEIYNGCIKNQNIKYRKDCDKCDTEGGKKTICNNCNGKGKTIYIQRIGPINMTNEILCNNCKGNGKIIIEKCKKCNGNTYIEDEKNIEIKIPAGITNNNFLFIKNNGHKLKNIDSDIKILIKEIPHNLYKRNEYNIEYIININLIEALKGFNREFIYLNGEKLIFNTNNITKPDTKLILKNKGLKNINNGEFGNLICYIKIDFPNNINNNWINELSNYSNKNEVITNFEIF
jgi:molecular chaperone DnaJ